MSFENTFERFKLISGLSSQEAQVWSGLVSESRDYLEGIVFKDDLLLSDKKRLDNAAAVYAYYRYLSYTVNDESYFSAGDLKVSYNRDKLKAAEKMWESELKSLGDIVDTSNSVFYFKRVI